MSNDLAGLAICEQILCLLAHTLPRSSQTTSRECLTGILFINLLPTDHLPNTRSDELARPELY
ncbi:hypothetical protein [Acinetobacter baumannii]|uniref:hypothetical protein n=1 Tax=Acinetobacter baumannii TaxID=470 RepID=UPI00164486BD|nr:hypothetical protein [Acinetobacter baumannii]